MNLKDIIAAFVRHRREVVTVVLFSNCVKLAIVLISLKHSRGAGEHRPDHRTDPSCADAAEAKTALVANPWQLGNVAASSNVLATMLRVRNGWSQSSAA